MSLPDRVDIASRSGVDETAGDLSTPGEDGATLAAADGADDALSTLNRPRRRQRDAPIDLVIARLARDRHRVVTWPELRAAGVSHRAVQHRVATGRLYRKYQGVYVLDPPDSVPRSTLLAAALAACGPDTMLSGYASAERWGLLPPAAGDIDVTVVGRNPGNRRSGIRVHRVGFLDPSDDRIHRGLRVTAPARVALELAAQLDGARLEDLVARARVEHTVTDREFAAVLERYPRYPGAAILRAVLARRGGPSFTRSEAERRLLDLIREAQIAPPATNFRVGRHEIDFVWARERLAVEVDGYAFHHDRAAFEHDRRRDAKMVAAGWRVMRFTWRQLVEEPLMVVARIAQVLGNAAE